MADFNQLRKQMGLEEQPVDPALYQQYNQMEPRNMLANALNMPSLAVSKGDTQDYNQNLPMDMGSAGMGTIGKVGAMENAAGGMAEKIAEQFPTIKRMFQIGDKIVPADSMGKAMQIKNALVKTGQADAHAIIQALDSNRGYGYDSIPKK